MCTLNIFIKIECKGRWPHLRHDSWVIEKTRPVSLLVGALQHERCEDVRFPNLGAGSARVSVKSERQLL